ncbi:hypothetical protein MMYC01_200442, partial [Madurella mycetomatis]
RAAECHSNYRAYTEDCRILDSSIWYSDSFALESPGHLVYGACYTSWPKVFSGTQSRFWADAIGTIRTASQGNFLDDDHNYVSGIIRE